MRRMLVCVIGLLLTSCPGDLKEAMRMYGYTPVRPASTFWQPGALVYVRKWEPLEVGFICSAQQVMGKDYKPMQSPTMNADLARATKRSVTFGTDFVDIVSGDGDLHAIKSVKMSLRNARLFEINDHDIDNRAAKVDSSCVRHVVRRRQQGYPITMIASALQADVIYTVQWDNSSKLDANAKIAQLENLAVKLGVEASSLGGRTIEAKGLIWGIRDDNYLAYLFDPKHLPATDRRASRLIDAEQLPTLTTGFDEIRRPSVAPPAFGPNARPPRTSSRKPSLAPLDPVDEADASPTTPTRASSGSDTDAEAEATAAAAADMAARPGLTIGEMQAAYPEQAAQTQWPTALGTPTPGKIVGADGNAVVASPAADATGTGTAPDVASSGAAAPAADAGPSAPAAAEAATPTAADGSASGTQSVEAATADAGAAAAAATPTQAGAELTSSTDQQAPSLVDDDEPEAEGSAPTSDAADPLTDAAAEAGTDPASSTEADATASVEADATTSEGASMSLVDDDEEGDTQTSAADAGAAADGNATSQPADASLDAGSTPAEDGQAATATTDADATAEFDAGYASPHRAAAGSADDAAPSADAPASDSSEAASASGAEASAPAADPNAVASPTKKATTASPAKGSKGSNAARRKGTSNRRNSLG